MRERHGTGNRRTNQPAARSPQIDRHPCLPRPGGGGVFKARKCERAGGRGSGERRKGTPVLVVFLFSCSMGKLNCFVKKKTATAISYKNTYRPHPIYHRRHISLVSSPLLVPSSRFSFMRLVHHLVHHLVSLISFSISPPDAHASSTLSHIDAILPRAKSRHPQIRTRTSWIKRRNPIDLPPPSQPEHGKQDATATTSHDDKRTPSPPPTPPTSHTSRHTPRKRHDKTGRDEQRPEEQNETRYGGTTRDANDIERHNEIHDKTIRKDETRQEANAIR